MAPRSSALVAVIDCHGGCGEWCVDRNGMANNVNSVRVKDQTLK